MFFPIQPGLVRKDSQIEFRALARRDAENALINELEKLQASAPEKELQVSEWVPDCYCKIFDYFKFLGRKNVNLWIPRWKVLALIHGLQILSTTPWANLIRAMVRSGV